MLAVLMSHVGSGFLSNLLLYNDEEYLMSETISNVPMPVGKCVAVLKNADWKDYALIPWK